MSAAETQSPQYGTFLQEANESLGGKVNFTGL